MGSNAVGGESVPEHTVTSITAFIMAKYEIKYAEWLTVKTYALANGYTFANPGAMGSASQNDQHPVTTINWRDAIIWCNAASQKAGLTPVYYTNSGMTTLLKSSTTSGSVNAAAGSEDNPYVNWSANGYRLPTEAEWEYVARYKDGTIFIRGDAPSGWQDSTPNTSVDNGEIDAVAWWTNNSSTATHVVGTGLPNSLGLFDMNGNVWEHTWDWHASNYTTSSPYTDADSKGPTSGSLRTIRSGAFNNGSNAVVASYRYSNVPWALANDLGLRPVRRP